MEFTIWDRTALLARFTSLLIMIDSTVSYDNKYVSYSELILKYVIIHVIDWLLSCAISLCQNCLLIEQQLGRFTLEDLYKAMPPSSMLLLFTDILCPSNVNQLLTHAKLTNCVMFTNFIFVKCNNKIYCNDNIIIIHLHWNHKYVHVL